MDTKAMRAAALVAAALNPYPGDKDLYTRADEGFHYIKEAIIPEEES